MWGHLREFRAFLPLPVPRVPHTPRIPPVVVTPGEDGTWLRWRSSQASRPGVISLCLGSFPAAPGAAQGVGLRQPPSKPLLELRL